MIEKPVFVLGAARSGTTLMGQNILSLHPNVVYWGEPDHIWRRYRAYRLHDVMDETDATERSKAYIRNCFERRLRGCVGERLVEKTPSNCLRLPFIIELFPDAKIVHVVRDGRDVARSVAKEWQGLGDEALDSPNLRSRDPISRFLGVASRQWQRQRGIRDIRALFELPKDFVRLVQTLCRYSLNTSRIPWGPRIPGLLRIRAAFSLLETCAIQWEWCVRAARSFGRSQSSAQYLELRYEDLISGPRMEIKKVLDFARLSYDDRVLSRMADNVVSRTVPKWPNRMSDLERQRVERLIGSTLESLGY